jgi:8-amino-7-oxononanoate synthase
MNTPKSMTNASKPTVKKSKEPRLDALLAPALAEAQTHHALRRLHTLSPTTMPFLVKDANGKLLHHFSSNDYLYLSQHPDLKQASQEAIETYGTGINSSRLVSGQHPLHDALETAVAQWKQTEASLVFSSGFQANLSVIHALCRHGTILSDKLNHASLVDGCRLAASEGASWQRYRHLDYADLEARLKKIRATDPHSPICLISDTLFSMDGDALDLATWCELASRYGAFTYVDEAHAAGVYGKARRSGLVEEAEMPFHVDIHMGTFSKALGGFGAYVGCSDIVRQTLINQARGFIYTTSMPPAVLAGNLASVQLLLGDARPTQALHDNIAYFHHVLKNFPALDALQVPRSQSQIIPFTVGDNALALQLEAAMYEAGFLLKAIRPPTVPQGQARLRLSLSAGHSRANILGCLEALNDAVLRL